MYVGNMLPNFNLANPNLDAASSKYGTAFSIAFSIATSPGANAGAILPNPANAVPPSTPNLARVLANVLYSFGFLATVSCASCAASLLSVPPCCILFCTATFISFSVGAVENL